MLKYQVNHHPTTTSNFSKLIDWRFFSFFRSRGYNKIQIYFNPMSLTSPNPTPTKVSNPASKIFRYYSSRYFQILTVRALAFHLYGNYLVLKVVVTTNWTTQKYHMKWITESDIMVFFRILMLK